MPTVSVIMPVHNSASHVGRAIDSILRQSFRDWELIVVDDASEDASAIIVSSFKDSRIRLLSNHQNRGIAFSLNRGIRESQGEHIARMDADDISLPHRLAIQIKFLSEHPEVGICGSWVKCFGMGRSFQVTWPIGKACLRSYMLFDTPFAHPTVCLRRSILEKSGLEYDEQLMAAQDYDLWFRCSEWTQLDNIPKVLLLYRIHRNSVTQTHQSLSDRIATSLLLRQLRKIGIEPSDEELHFHRQVGHGGGMKSWSELYRAEIWLRYLLKYNQAYGFFPGEGMIRAISFVWWRICMNSAFLGPRVWLFFFRSPLSKGYSPLFRERIVLVLKSLLSIVGSVTRPTGRLPIWDHIHEAQK